MLLPISVKNEFDRLEFNKHRYLLAFSGGPDSVYLLWMVKEYYKEDLNNHIALCYINYHDSPYVDIEEKLVLDYARDFNIKIFKYDTKFNKDKDKNFENWARLYRYDLFAKIVNEHHFDGLLTAHQKTDHVETYLLQTKRNNLPLHYGLKIVNKFQDIKIIRPLLSISKQELTEELINNKVPFYDDITNKDPHKARTLIREALTEEDLNNYENIIQKKNEELVSLYHRFHKYPDGLPFAIYDSFVDEEKKRYCFFLLDQFNLRKRREGYGKLIYDFLKKKEAGQLKLLDDYVLYRTKKLFFVSKDLSKINYSFKYDEPNIYQNEYFSIDLTDPSLFNFKSFPVEIRTVRKGDKIATNLPTKDVFKALQKQSVPFYLHSCYPVFIVDGKIVCVPFYKDIKEKKIPFKINYFR